MYYGLIILSVVMFGGCFALQDVYRARQGDHLRASLQYGIIGSAAGLVVLWITNGFALEFTLFTLLMALVRALVSISFTFFSFRALGVANLSVYSLFSMLGGMVLPFLQGILFYEETFTIGKLLCLLLIAAAILMTVKRGGGKGGFIYYVGVFLLNGMSGVIAKLFAEAPFEKTSAAGFSLLSAACTLVLSLAIFLIFYRKREEGMPPLSLSSIGVGAAGGAVNNIANFFLVIALSHVEASVQYPMVTGGVIIVSTLLCYFGKKKPSKRELLSVALAFAAMMVLFLVPV